MAKSVYYHNCIREIRQSVYGRDNRKPIADAIEIVKDNTPERSNIQIKIFNGAEVEALGQEDYYTLVIHSTDEQNE